MLSNKELENITGGGIHWGVFAIVGVALSLIAGILDGYYRPMKCN